MGKLDEQKGYIKRYGNLSKGGESWEVSEKQLLIYI